MRCDVISGMEVSLKTYVEAVFEEERALDNEEVASFGELMRTGEARISFAKEINSRRSSMNVGVNTYHKLLHSVSLALFECSKEDNFLPGSVIMNMSFTYFYLPRGKLLAAQITHPRTLRSGKDANAGISANDECCSGTCSRSFSKALMWLQEESCVKGSSSGARGDVNEGFHFASPTSQIYLYESMRNLHVWQSERFWQEIFFLSSGFERRKQWTTRPWSTLGPDERREYNRTFSNIMFAQLTAFLNHMKQLRLPETMRRNFLEKQSVIGGIPRGTEMHVSLLSLV